MVGQTKKNHGNTKIKLEITIDWQRIHKSEDFLPEVCGRHS